MLGLHEKWRSTFMEAWPDEVIALGLPLEQISLSEQDRLAIGGRTAVFREIFEIDELPPFSKGPGTSCPWWGAGAAPLLHHPTRSAARRWT